MSVADAVVSKWPGLEGFSLVNKPANPRLVIDVYGGQKVGKSTLALSFPKPIVCMNLDMGLEELFITRPELLGDVFKRDLHMNELTDPATWGPLLKEFHEHYVRGLEFVNEHGGTMMVDTATQLWQIVQTVMVDQVREERIENAIKRAAGKPSHLASEIIERAEKPNRMDYGNANGFMGGLLRRALHYPNVNAIFIHRAKPKFDNNGRQIEGAWEFHGFGETPAITQAHLWLYKKQESGVPGGVHYAMIENSRHNSELDGMTIKRPTYEVLRGIILGE